MCRNNMNPKFTNLKGATIVVSDSVGQYEFVCSKARRGSGSSKYVLDIEGFGTSEPKLQTQYFFEFNGQKFGASFQKTIETDGSIFKVELGTLVSDPEFWT